MSRMATNEYIGAKRRLYATADREKRIKMLDEVCETTGYERKEHLGSDLWKCVIFRRLARFLLFIC